MSESYRCRDIVMLLPCDLSTKAAQAALVGADYVYALKGRFTFGNADAGAKFGSLLAIWSDIKPDRLATLDGVPLTAHRVI